MMMLDYSERLHRFSSVSVMIMSIKLTRRYSKYWFVQSIKLNLSTVKPLNSGHHWFSEKVSATERCPLYRGSKYKGLTITGDDWFLEKVSAIERCPL